MAKDLLEMQIRLPNKVAKFYEKVAKRSGTDVSTVLTVVLALQSMRRIDEGKEGGGSYVE